MIMQKIDFVEIPNVRPKDYFLTLRQVYSRIESHQPTFKEFRRWMREKGWWDKANAVELMNVLGIGSTNPVGMQPFALEIAGESDEEHGKELIARRLIELNPLLAKYCLESMDVENDGRIQSTRELFKLVDSFVYPGTKPTLTAFNAWMSWAEAGGLVRLIGIRWGLSALARQMMPRLRAIDADEFLEDEEAGEDDVPVFEPAPVEKIAETPVEDEEILQDQEPDVPDRVVKTEEPSYDDFSPSQVPVPVRSPLVPSFYMVFSGPATDTASLKKNAVMISDWWSSYPSKQDLNFSVLRDMDGSVVTRLHAFFVALNIGRGHEFNKVMMVAGSLRAAGVFDALAKGKSPVSGIKKAYQGAWNLKTAAMTESSAFMISQAGAIRAFDFNAFNGPDTLLDALETEIFMGVGGLAAFVAARIAINTGLLNKSMSAAGFIPFFTARQQAFRMGFIDRLYCNDFNELKETALTLAGLFGPDASFEQAFLQMPGAFGCAFNCGHQANCPFQCREKIAYNV